MNDRNGIKYNENEEKLYEDSFFFLCLFSTEWTFEIDAREEEKKNKIQNQVIDMKSHASALLSPDEHTQRNIYVFWKPIEQDARKII